MCPSRAVFVDTDAAIFLFSVSPRQAHKSRPAYVCGKQGFYEGFEWTLKQHRYFTDIWLLKVWAMFPSRAVFVDTDAAIFLFSVSPRQPDKSRPAYVYGKTRVLWGFWMDVKTTHLFHRYFTANGADDVLQQSATRRHRRRHISVSCFADSTRQITPSLGLWENEGLTRVLNGR